MLCKIGECPNPSGSYGLQYSGPQTFEGSELPPRGIYPHRRRNLQMGWRGTAGCTLMPGILENTAKVALRKP